MYYDITGQLARQRQADLIAEARHARRVRAVEPSARRDRRRRRQVDATNRTSVPTNVRHRNAEDAHSCAR